jgi:urea transport system substrate-binding protein
MDFTRRDLLKSATGVVASVAAYDAVILSKVHAANDEIVIATIYDQSGGLEVYGTPMNMTCQLAVEEINASGGLLGKKVRIVVYDPQSNMNQYAQFAQEAALREKVAIVQGAITSASREVMRPILDRYRTLLWYSVHYEGGVCDMNTMVSGSSAFQQTIPITEYGLKTYGKRVYYIGADYNAPQIIGDWVHKYTKEHGGEFLGKDLFPLDVTEFGPAISKIQAAKPDYLWACLVGGAHVSFYRQWAAAGMLSKIPMCSLTFGSGNEHIALQPSESEGIMSGKNYYQELETPENKKFVDAFKKRFGKDAPYVNTIGIGGYIGTMMWAEAVRNAKSTDREKVLAALRAPLSWRGPSGLMTVDPASNHCIQDVHLAKVKNGKFEVFQTIPQLRPDDVADRCNLVKNPKTAEQFTPILN